MTKKEFKRAMCCGLWRCVQELESVANIETHRDILGYRCGACGWMHNRRIIRCGRCAGEGC